MKAKKTGKKTRGSRAGVGIARCGTAGGAR